MFLCVLVAATAAIITTINIQTRKATVKYSAPTTARMIKQKLLNLVLTPSSWQIIQAKNNQAFINFNPDVPPLIEIYQVNSTGSAYYASNSPTAGFDYNAQPCNSYSNDLTAEGNDACPFRYNIYLKSRVQVNDNWVDTLKFELAYRPKNKDIIFNPNSPEFNFDIARNLNEQSIESSCISIGGVYNDLTHECSNKLTNPVSNCGPGKILKSQQNIQSSANCVNTSIKSFTCNGNQVIKGFNQQGNPICGTAH